MKKLSSYEKFKPGAKLWCFFFEPERDLFKKINWRSQFMIHKIKEELSLTQALLIESSSFFPNQYLLCLPKTYSSQQSYDIWVQLKKPSLRLFLALKFKQDFLQPWFSDPVALERVSYYSEK